MLASQYLWMLRPTHRHYEVTLLPDMIGNVSDTVRRLKYIPTKPSAGLLSTMEISLYNLPVTAQHLNVRWQPGGGEQAQQVGDGYICVVCNLH